MRIAMWSGPRNLSTAMMYSFGARPDFAVWDEPFFAPYLKATGAAHPMREETIAAHETDSAKVALRCAGPIPEDKPHFYMKHMPHHMLPDFPLDWASECVNVHLLRHPARVIASYTAKRDDVTLDDIGFPQQVRIFETLGGLVIDSAHIRQDPERALARLCALIGLDFDEQMLRWPAGGHPSDGAWAPHWYGAVHRSTTFAGPEGPLPKLTGGHKELEDRAMGFYDAMMSECIDLLDSSMSGSTYSVNTG